MHILRPCPALLCQKLWLWGWQAAFSQTWGSGAPQRARLQDWTLLPWPKGDMSKDTYRRFLDNNGKNKGERTEVAQMFIAECNIVSCVTHCNR